MVRKSLIHCPNCNHEFPIETALGAEIEQRLKAEFHAKIEQQKKEVELQKKELEQKIREFEENREKAQREYKEKLESDRKRIREELHASQQQDLLKLLELEKSKLSKEVELEMQRFKTQLELAEKDRERLKGVALENEKLKSDIVNIKFELELDFQKKLREALAKESENNKKRLEEEFELKFKDKEHEMNSLKKQIDELKKRAEQGSMQAQGEVMELALEESLRHLFPQDLIEEVGKGVKGADIVHTVIENGNNCGKIIYESKRTKNFSSEWIPKLKEDMMASKAEVAILVTETMPKDTKMLGLLDGVWVCSFQDYKGLALALREGMVKVSLALKSQENKADKMVMLYDYLTSTEFKQNMQNLVEGFSTMRDSITRERVAMEKIWKEREKGLEKMLLSVSGFYGSIKGIAGSAVPELGFLDSNKLIE